MKSDKLRRGFTLIEMVVVLAIFLMIAFLTVPQFMNMVNRSRIEGTAREVSFLMRAARLEAIKRNCYGVVKIDTAKRQFIAFADRDRDGILNTAATPPDVVIGAIDLPKTLDFKDESGNTGLASIKPLDLINPDVPVVLPDKQVMFQSDGSVLSTGALRIADLRGNVMEVNVEPQTSGKVQVRKYEVNKYVAKGEVREWKFQ